MTREEAITQVRLLRDMAYTMNDNRMKEATDLAIEALQTEQNAYKEGYDACKRIMAREKQFNSYCPKCMGKLEPCEDAISRSELLKAIDTWDKFGFEHTGCFVREPKDDFVTYVHYDDVVKCIKGMPSVQPEPFINKPCISEQACREDKLKVLDKIRAEILAYDNLIGHNAQVRWCLSIIDKYREEQNYDKGRNS